MVPAQMSLFTPKVQAIVKEKFATPEEELQVSTTREEMKMETTASTPTTKESTTQTTTHQGIVRFITKDKQHESVIVKIKVSTDGATPGKKDEAVSYTFTCTCGGPALYCLPCEHNAKHAGLLGLQQHEIADPRYLGSSWVESRKAAGVFRPVREPSTFVGTISRVSGLTLCMIFKACDEYILAVSRQGRGDWCCLQWHTLHCVSQAQA